MAIHAATMNDGHLGSLVPCIRCTCVNEITIKRDATQQSLGGQLRKDVCQWVPRSINRNIVVDVRSALTRFEKPLREQAFL